MPRTLYLPIHIPGTYHERSVANKRGLREALATRGPVYELDYLAVPAENLYRRVRELINNFKPTLLFTQLQGLNCLSPDQLRAIRQDYGLPIVNWNGDYWPEHLISPGMLDLLRAVDLQLVINASVLIDYEAQGVNAAFWPFGYEPITLPLPEVPAYDVVFLGNNYSDKRQRLYDILRTLPCSVGIYGSGWPQAEGECNYDFSYAHALYSNAKLTISDNQFPEAEGYLSDRPFQAMAAGCFVMQQNVMRLKDYTKFESDVSYGWFYDLAELPNRSEYWLRCNAKRIAIAHKAQRFVRRFHSWDSRVKTLFEELLPERVDA